MIDTLSVHRQAWDLIPWIVNGTAPESEWRAVQAHLESCQDCREEFDFQRQLRSAMAQQGGSESDIRESWLQLRGRLDLAAEPRAFAMRAQRGTRGIGKTAMPWLIAAMVVQAIGLAALGAAWWSRPIGASVPPGSTAVYRTLSAPEAAPQAATIRVVFAPDATLAQVQAMLAAARLQVRAGPSDVGVWALGPVRDSNRAATEAALRELRASSEVRFAEALAGAP